MALIGDLPGFGGPESTKESRNIFFKHLYILWNLKGFICWSFGFHLNFRFSTILNRNKQIFTDRKKEKQTAGSQ